MVYSSCTSHRGAFRRPASLCGSASPCFCSAQPVFNFTLPRQLCSVMWKWDVEFTITRTPFQKKRNKNMGDNWWHLSVWYLLVCKLPEGRDSALCTVFAPHMRVFDPCDFVIFLISKYVSNLCTKEPSQPTGFYLMMSFLFLSQWCASSTSHRRDRRKRLLGCGSRDPGCGNRLGGLWCRGEGIVNWFVSQWHQLLCVIK